VPTHNRFNPHKAYIFSCWARKPGHTSTQCPHYCPSRDRRMEDYGREGYIEEEEEQESRQEIREGDKQ
jgi:hypothetical protein